MEPRTWLLCLQVGLISFQWLKGSEDMHDLTEAIAITGENRNFPRYGRAVLSLKRVLCAQAHISAHSHTFSYSSHMCTHSNEIQIKNT